MEKKSIPKNQLLERCRQAMQGYGMSTSTIRNYMRFYRHLYYFMDTNGLEQCTEDIGVDFYTWFKSESTRSDHSKCLAQRVTKLLRLIVNDLPYEAQYTYKHKEYEFRGQIGEVAKAFIDSLANEHLRPRTIYTRRYTLSLFSIGMANKGITLDNITEDDLISYISCQHTSRNQVITSLRLFFRYLYKQQLISIDLSENLKNVKRTPHEKILSFYTAEEISKIESTIDRRTKNGKRNYAMILLATRLGLRASDVAGLRFNEIDWENCIITRKQYKTGRAITLPLLSDVGEAMIDYILHARPRTNGIDSIFISHVQPYRPCSPTAFSCLVKRTIHRSGVSYENRHTGAHSLRHSLATTLMNDGVEFPVISEVLGHGSTASTSYYLGVSIKNLLECSLDVPIVDEGFYIQKGGKFYE